MLVQKYDRLGNFSKTNQAICSDLKPLLSPTTLPKMQPKNPQGPLDFDDLFWSSQHDFSNLPQQCDWPTIEADFFSLKKIQQYWASRPALGVQDIDGWCCKEHFGRLWTGNNHRLKELIRAHIILPYGDGDFEAHHLSEIAGAKYFGLDKGQRQLCSIVIGGSDSSCWSNLFVVFCRDDVANFFVSESPNFIQFAGQPNDATRYNQVAQLLASELGQAASNEPLVVLQTDMSNASLPIC
jgi:hypothetical protein